MGRNEVQAAVTSVVALSRAATVSSTSGFGVMNVAISAGSNAIAGVSVNSIDQPTIDLLTAAFVSISAGRDTVALALGNLTNGIDAANAALRS